MQGQTMNINIWGVCDKNLQAHNTKTEWHACFGQQAVEIERTFSLTNIIQSILIYFSETKEMTNRDRQRLNAADTDCRRGRRLARTRNAEIRERLGQRDTTVNEQRLGSPKK